MISLPFTFSSDKSIEISNKTDEYLVANNAIGDEIMDLSWIYHSLHNIIPVTTDNFWSGHSFPYNESWDELQISFSLCQFGLYKQAMSSLRNALELGLLSVYYNLNDLGHETVKGWLSSIDSREYDTPRFAAVWKILSLHQNVEAFQKEIDLKQQLVDLNYLHNYVHTKGVKFSNSLGLTKANSQTFEIKGLTNWLKAFKEIVIILTTLHLLKYPTGLITYDYHKKFGINVPMFSHLRSFEIDRIRKIFPEKHFNALNQISMNDPETADFLEWVESHQDMTEEQVEEQIVDMDKRHIDGAGFLHHLKNELVLYRSTSRNELPDNVKRRLTLLEKWAKENNCYEPKFKLPK